MKQVGATIGRPPLVIKYRKDDYTMKRLLALILSLALCFCFASCKKDEKKQSKIGVDVEYYANAGQIPEFPYHLGQDVDKMLKELEEKQKEAEEKYADHDHDHSDEIESNFHYHNEEMGWIQTYGDNGYIYRYDPKNKSKGINRIISSNTAYGFKTSDVSSEVRDALSSYGFNAKERDLTDKEISYYGASENATCLEYKFGANTVLFVFNDNALFLTTLFVNE